jgi:hypothetical protein
MNCGVNYAVGLLVCKDRRSVLSFHIAISRPVCARVASYGSISMQSSVQCKQAAGGMVVTESDRQAAENLVNLLGLRGSFQVEHVRNGEVLDTYDFPNGIINEGKNKLLDVMFHTVTQIGTWYLGLINLAGYTALAADDTYDDIDQAGNGWDEFASYTDPGNTNSTVTRPQWTEGAASGQSITNGTVVVFDITGSGTVKGLFLVGGTNAQTKSDHTAANTLWATALFAGGDVAVQNADQLKVTYTVSA